MYTTANVNVQVADEIMNENQELGQNQANDTNVDAPEAVERDVADDVEQPANAENGNLCSVEFRHTYKLQQVLFQLLRLGILPVFYAHNHTKIHTHHMHTYHI